MAIVQTPTVEFPESHPVFILPGPLRLLWKKRRYKVFWGGRGGAKSWGIARYLLARALIGRVRIGCFRELQSSIRDSVHQLLKEQIWMLGLIGYFKITEYSIYCPSTGSEFIFKGLRHNIIEIKSTEGIDIAWVEEAQLVTKDSWDILTPTIRKEGSEIIVSYNPIEETDETHKRFVSGTPPPNAIIVKVGWQNNPWFTGTQDQDRRWMLANDPDAYWHVWEGECKRIGDDVILKNKFVIDTFDSPTDQQVVDGEIRYFHGADFGFANDPSTLNRSWITGEPPEEELWIDQECWGIGVEIDEMPEFYCGHVLNRATGRWDRKESRWHKISAEGEAFTGIQTAMRWPIKADESRPETISYVARQGFNITGAEKWDGSVEDGIAHLRGFKLIHIHQRCKNTALEARLWRYKRDPKTNEVLPVPIDKHNHTWDGIRYGMDGYIQRRGVDGVWLRL